MSKKILIIDDEGSDRKGISIALGKEGYSEIIVADTGDAGVQMAKSFSPDIILIDVVLQGMDGFDVCRQIKEDGECQAKIIMITGHLDAVDAEKARKSSANEIIEKTVSFENISINGIRMLTGLILPKNRGYSMFQFELPWMCSGLI